MMRRLLMVLGVIVAIDAGLFLAALVTRHPMPQANVVVVAEREVALHEAPLVVRVSAFIPGAAKSLALTEAARARLGDAPEVGFVDNIARVPIGVLGAQILQLLLDDGHGSLGVWRCVVDVVAAHPSHDTVSESVAVRVPISGMRTATVSIVSVPHAGASLAVHATVPDQDDVVLELLIDGVLRDAVAVHIKRSIDATVSIPTDAAPGALVVVHAAVPWPAARGPYAIARVGASFEKPPPAGIAMRPALLRPAPLPCDAATDDTGALFKRAFEWASGLLWALLSVVVWALSRGQGAAALTRAAAVTLALALLLLGLDLAVRLP